MRFVLLSVLAAWSGCSTDVCASFDGQTCIALEVKGTSQIDQLGISIDMVLSRQLTPSAPRVDPLSLPVWVAVLPGDQFPTDQPLRIFVDAFLGGSLVGQALGELTMTPGQHVSAAITLTDLTSDLAGADLSGLDFSHSTSSPAFLAANNGLFGGEIDALLADFATDGAYLGTAGAGVFKTVNRGVTWTPVNHGLDAVFISTLISDDISGAIYASGTRVDRSAALYQTVDGAQSWSHVLDTSSAGPVLATVDSLANPVLLVGLPNGGGVLRSTDGINFTPKNAGLTDLSVTSLAADPLTRGSLYAGTASLKVFNTTDFGESWSAVSVAASSTSPIRSLVFNPHTEDLIAASEVGLFRLPFGQPGFVAFSPAPPSVNPSTLAYVQTASADLYLGGTPGIFHLDGNQTSWSNASSGLGDSNVVSLAIDRTSASVLYAGTLFGGLQVSSNAGDSWTPSNRGITNLSMLRVAIAPSDQQTIYGGSQHAGMFKSLDGGVSWSAINNGLPANAGIAALAVHPLTATTLFAATQDTSASGIVQAVFRSLDGGSSWTQVDSSSSQALAFDPSNGMTVYAGTTTGSVRQSLADGNSFTAVGSVPSAISSLLVDPTNGAIVYASTFGNGVFRSGDSGQSWAPSSSGISESQVNCLAIDPATPTHLWASGFQSLYRSSDAATSWQQAGSGVSGQAWNSVRFAGNNRLYTSSNAGIFRSTDGAVSWSQLGGGLPAQDLAVDPSDGNTVYFAHIGGPGVTRTTTGGI